MNNRKKQICSFLTSGLLFSFSSFAYVNGMENQNNPYLDKLKEINDNDYGDLSSDNYDIFNVFSIGNRNYDSPFFYDKSPEKAPTFIDAGTQTDKIDSGASINQYASDPKNFSGRDPESRQKAFYLFFCIINHQYDVAVRVPGREYPSLCQELKKIVCPSVAQFKFNAICNYLDENNIMNHLNELKLICCGLCDDTERQFDPEILRKHPRRIDVYKFLRHNRKNTNAPQGTVSLDQQTINCFFEVQSKINSALVDIAKILSGYNTEVLRRTLCDGKIFLSYFGNYLPLPVADPQPVIEIRFNTTINPSSPIDHKFTSHKRDRHDSPTSKNNKETDQEFTIKNKKLDSNSNFTMHTRSMDRNFKKNQ